MTTHSYSAHLVWQGSTAQGYRAYSRQHRAVTPPATSSVTMSSDPHFRGNPDLMNPEQLVVLAASSCQLLSFLAVAARAEIDVLDYEDDAVGTMTDSETPMHINRIELFPHIRVGQGVDRSHVLELVQQAHHECYVANSLISEVVVSATIDGC